jgi:hypothetical protein
MLGGRKRTDSGITMNQRDYNNLIFSYEFVESGYLLGFLM